MPSARSLHETSSKSLGPKPPPTRYFPPHFETAQLPARLQELCAPDPPRTPRAQQTPPHKSPAKSQQLLTALFSRHKEYAETPPFRDLIALHNLFAPPFLHCAPPSCLNPSLHLQFKKVAARAPRIVSHFPQIRQDERNSGCIQGCSGSFAE